jgi:ABC-type microcin C transport system permease subunit YejE
MVAGALSILCLGCAVVGVIQGQFVGGFTIFRIWPRMAISQDERHIEFWSGIALCVLASMLFAVLAARVFLG